MLFWSMWEVPGGFARMVEDNWPSANTHTGTCSVWILHYMLIHSFKSCCLKSESQWYKEDILCCFFESTANSLIHLHTCFILSFQFGNKARLVLKEALNIWLAGVTYLKKTQLRFLSYFNVAPFFLYSVTVKTPAAMLQDSQKQLYWYVYLYKQKGKEY